MNYFNYFTEIEETFVRRRGKHLLLSPIDWAMIEGWKEQGVPLHIVIRGIETVFDAWEKKPSTRTIKGLLYCREEIEAQYAEWLTMQAGAAAASEPPTGNGFSKESVAGYVDEAIQKLRANKSEALREDFERAALRLQELRSNLSEDFEVIDKSLCDVEKFLDNALLTKSAPEHLKKLEKEIAAELKAYKSGMDADAYKQTFDLVLLKRLREAENVPRLGLFYL